MSETRKLGPNMKHLLAYKVAHASIPAGGGMAAALDVLSTPGKLAQISRESLAWIDQAIAVFKTAPDNPYGDDDEAIAGAIVAELDNRP